MIKNEYNVTKELYRQWSREAIADSNKSEYRAVRMLKVFWTVFAAGLFAAAAYTGTMLFAVFGIFCVYRGFIRRRLLSDRIYDIMVRDRGGAWHRTIEIADTIRVDDIVSVTEFRYSDMLGVGEDGNKIFFEFPSGRLRLYKDCFTQGSWEECRALIELKREEAKGKTEKELP